MQPRVPHATIVLTRRDDVVGTWTLMGEPRVDLALVNEVARWLLAARRLGCSIRLRDADRDLIDLLDLVGLVEVCGQPVGLEQLGTEERVEPGDPAV